MQWKIFNKVKLLLRMHSLSMTIIYCCIANEYFRFGRDVPNIVDAIKKNVSKFEREPLGPLGMHYTYLFQ